MKNVVLKMSLMLVAGTGLYYSLPDDSCQIKALAFENVEALAAGEGNGGMNCYNSGSVDCLGHKVEVKISGYSLDNE